MQFAQKAPKGFGKYFDKERSETSESDATKSEPSGQPKESSGDGQAVHPEPSEKKQKTDPPKVIQFKYKGKGGGGSGSPFGGGSDKEKLYLYGGLAIGVIAGFFALKEAIYHEIAWQEFVLRSERYAFMG